MLSYDTGSVGFPPAVDPRDLHPKSFLPLKHYFDKGTPLTISMWDYSWLKCSHPGGSFHDLTLCVAKAAERRSNLYILNSVRT